MGVSPPLFLWMRLDLFAGEKQRVKEVYIETKRCKITTEFEPFRMFSNYGISKLISKEKCHHGYANFCTQENKSLLSCKIKIISNIRRSLTDVQSEKCVSSMLFFLARRTFKSTSPSLKIPFLVMLFPGKLHHYVTIITDLTFTSLFTAVTQVRATSLKGQICGYLL